MHLAIVRFFLLVANGTVAKINKDRRATIG